MKGLVTRDENNNCHFTGNRRHEIFSFDGDNDYVLSFNILTTPSAPA